MDNKEFGKLLEKRTLDFAIAIVKLSGTLPNSPEARIIRNQITKSGTSIGANYREANRSRSKPDFYNRIKISQAEASETIYWLDIIDQLEWTDPVKISSLRNECSELLAIFTSASNNTRNKI